MDVRLSNIILGAVGPNLLAWRQSGLKWSHLETFSGGQRRLLRPVLCGELLLDLGGDGFGRGQQKTVSVGLEIRA
jgi:hypothetical protein